MCKLLKSIYGLKQSSRQWYLRFHETMMSNQFEMMDEDHCIYVKKSNDKFVILTPYVDDILIVGNHVEYLLIIKELLSFNFKMKNMGESSYILGVKIHRNHSKRLTLSQEQYI